MSADVRPSVAVYDLRAEAEVASEVAAQLEERAAQQEEGETP